MGQIEDNERFELFQNQTTSIAKQLEKIAEITMKMAEINIADTSNPNFVSLMNNHKKLTDYMDEVIYKYEQYLKK